MPDPQPTDGSASLIGIAWALQGWYWAQLELNLTFDSVFPSIKKTAVYFFRLSEDSSLACAETMLFVLVVAFYYLSFVLAVSFSRQSGGGIDNTNDGIHLVIGPNCGKLSNNFSDVNAGLEDLASYKTIVSFGDSYSNIQYYSACYVS